SILEQDPLWDVYHLRAVSILQERVASQLQDLYGSDDRVDATQHGDGTGIRERAWHLAKRLRLLESELLEKAYSYYEDQKLQLMQSETVLRYLSGPDVEQDEDFS
ncbi:hypothetical protein KCU79_g14531, partial [Aureobasidium melanogenum]